jgi:predicted dinucleotide-binding enzyme
LQHLFPFSKVVQSFEVADNLTIPFLNGNDEEAVKAVLTLFTSIGLKANMI